MHHFILGTAGHIDHGKSSLVRALTGTDPDRLPEEKARGMTITLGFAHLGLESADGTPLDIGIVDVPGHADFIRQMVFGAAGMDLALLVVAADDGWMPQTEEHLQILDYLGVERGVVAVTKADTSDDPEFAVEVVREELVGTFLADAPVIAVSAVRGTGIEELRGALAAAFSELPPKSDTGTPRLAFDRVFSPKGVGTIVTGTLTGGTLRRGEAVRLLPEDLAATVRGLQHHGQAIDPALPGMRTAVQLGDVGLATKARAGARRGQVLTTPGHAPATRVVEVLITRSPRTHPQLPPPPGPKTRQRVAVQHAGKAVTGTLLMQGADRLPTGGRTTARIRLEEPLPVLEGDRVLLRDAGHHHTLAGALVLDIAPPPGAFSRPARQAFLAARADALEAADPAAFLRARLDRDRVVLLAGTFRTANFATGSHQAAANALEEEGLLARAGDRVLHRPWWEEALAIAEQKVDAHHKKKPEEDGLPLESLRRALAEAASDRTVFTALLGALADHGIVREGTVVRRAAHQPNLAPGLRETADRMLKRLTDDPLSPPTRKELVEDSKTEKVLRFFIRTGEVVDLDERSVIHRDGFERIRQAVLDHLRHHPASRAADLRDACGTSRKLLMPILEILDARGDTIRDGDFRSLPP